MKKLILCTMTVLAFLSLSSTQSFATTVSDSTSQITATSTDLKRGESLVARLDEIKAMDKSTLNFNEKRQLRKETRSIKKELAVTNGGVYLSVGAIIIIVLLLILLL